MAARFLSSAFAAGPALLILLAFIVRKLSKFEPGTEAIQTLAKIVTYAMSINVFFFFLELFTAFYSNIPGDMASIKYLFVGLEGHTNLVPFMWTAGVLAFVGLALLLNPNTRKNESILPYALIAVYVASWIDKGMGLVVGGFIPNPFERVIEYSPTVPELLITLGVYGIGALVLTVLYKVAISVKEEVEAGGAGEASYH